MATFTWFGGSGLGDVPTNWTPSGPPSTGDTAIVNAGTVELIDAELSSNTVSLNAGTFQFTNDTGLFLSGGSLVSGLDQDSEIFTGASAAAEIDTFGDFVNEGLIDATGTRHTSTTIKIAQDGTAPGYYLNYGVIEAAAGNSMTISVVGTSELFNANLIYANGGTILINGGSGIAGGYAPMLGGVALVGDGGTLELNAGFPSGTEGSSPVFAFYDGDSGDTLKLDQLGQFGGRILGFQQGDTIDLGGSLSVGTIVVTNDGRVLLESGGGAVLDTLVLSSGAYNTGTFTVSGGIADGFTLTPGGDGDTLLSTSVVNSVWNNKSGTWQTASDWSTGVAPGSTATAVIGINPSGDATGTISPFTITTGSAAVTVNSLAEVNSSATLQITSDTTVGTSTSEYGISQVAGEIEVTAGNTLASTFLRQDTPNSDLQIDSGGVLALTGHSNLGLANNGTLTETTVVNGTTFANGNTIGLFVTGTATVDGGRIADGLVLSGTSVVSTGGFTAIGLDGGGFPSVMTVESGGTVIDTYADLSSDPTSFGMLTLTGSGTTWDDHGDPTDTLNTRGFMLVGNNNLSADQPSPLPAGVAQLVVENGATLNEATYAEIGDSVDSAGSATIASGGIWNIGTAGEVGFLNVGNSGSGTLFINAGTVIDSAGGAALTQNGTLNATAQGMGIAHHTGSDGTVVVEGSGSASGLLTVDNNATVSGGGFGVGQNGHGVLEILDHGTVSIANGGISAGSTLGGDGTISVGSGDGQSALLIDVGSSLSSGFGIGKEGTGTLFVNKGGTVEISGGGINVGSSAGAFGFAEINGGLLTDPTNGMTVGNTGTGFLEVINGGSIAFSAAGITVGSDTGASGTLDLESGTITVFKGLLVGDSASSNGTVIVHGGLYTGSGSFTDGSAGTGTLDINGGTVAFNGTMTLGLQATGTGDLSVANGMLSGSTLTVGSAGHGTVDIGIGGVVQASVVTVNGGGVLDLTGGVLDPVAAITVNGAGAIGGFGTLDSSVVLNTSTADVTASGGTLDIVGAVSGSGTLDLAAGSGLKLDAAPGSTPTVTFASGGTETLILNDPSISTTGGGNIFTALTGVNVGDLIDFGGSIVINSTTSAAGTNGTNVTVNVTEGATKGTVILDNVQFAGGTQFFITTDPTTHLNALEAEVPCFAAGTRIATPRGEIPVEDLRVGDLVKTMLRETAAPVIWAGRREVDCARHKQPKKVWPVRVAAGAFGPGRPQCDLFLSPDHAVYVNAVLIPVRHLINGSTIAQVAVERVAYHHLELAEHDVLLAEGLPAESFLDMKDGSNYANRPGPVRLYPDFSVRIWEAFGCARLVVTGPELEAARALVDSFAEARNAA